jgi:uncharacterized MnhB-related membrane protein
MTAVSILILIVLVLAALITVMTTRLLSAIIALAATSAMVSIVLFRLHAPIAAVFELSVGAGLIPAIFLSVIGMTQRLTPESISARRKEKLRIYWALPIIVLLVGVALTQVQLVFPVSTAAPVASDVRTVIWTYRHVDLLGQILVLLGGSFGVVVLVKELNP